MLTNEMPYAASAGRAKTRTKAKTKSHRQGVSAFYVVQCVALFLLLALLLYRETEVTILTEEITALEATSEKLVAKRDAILRELAPSMTQDRVEKIAKGSLGMDYPTSKQTVRVAVKGTTETQQDTNPQKSEKNMLAKIFGLLFTGRDEV